MHGNEKKYLGNQIYLYYQKYKTMISYKHWCHNKVWDVEDVLENCYKKYPGDSVDSNIRFLFWQEIKKWTSQKQKRQDSISVTTITSRFWFIHNSLKLWLLSQLTSTLTSAKLYVKFNILIKLSVVFKSLSK